MAWFSVLIFVALLNVGKALPWDGPRQSLSATNTANWSPAPTSNQPKEDLRLRPRAIYSVFVCGWIDGNGYQAALCSTDSSCAWNTDITRVGCCATKNNACTFYTDCTTAATLGPEGVIGSKYTCVSGATCYQNTYPGGYLQYGCGTVEGYEGTTVATSFASENTGQPNPLQIIYVGNSAAITTAAPAITTTPTETSAEIPPETTTDSPTTSVSVESNPTTTPATSETETTPSAASSSSTILSETSISSSEKPSSTSPSKSTSSAATTTTTIISAPITSSSPSPKNSTPTGAIVGGAVGGFAVLALLIALCLIGRRKGWFSKSSPSSHPIGEIAYPNDTPPRYQTPQPYIPSEPKLAELPSPEMAYGGARGVSMLSSERSYGRSDYSPATSPRIDDGSMYGSGSEGPRSSGPMLVDDRFMRARMGGRGPTYEVQ